MKHILPGICYATTEEGIEVWKVGKKGTTHFCEEVVEIVGPWEYRGKDIGSEKVRLARLMSRAKGFKKKIKRERLWEELDRHYPQGATLEEILSNLYQEQDSTDLAFRLMLALYLHNQPIFHCQVIAYDEILYRAISKGQDLTIGRERLEQNAAMALVDSYFSSTSGLYKKSMNLEEGKILLYFNFPSVAKRSYEEKRVKLEEESGWLIEIGDRVNMAVIKDTVLETLPQDSRLLANPSYYPDREEVVIQLKEIPGGWDRIQKTFLEKTDLSLMAMPSPSPSKRQRHSLEGVLEINEAFRVIEDVLGSLLHKKSRKVDAKGTSFIELGFLTPAVGERYRERIVRLSKETGWELTISPSVNQHALKALAKEMVGATMEVTKEPSYFPGRNLVKVQVRGDREGEGLEKEFFDKTGCALEIKVL